MSNSFKETWLRTTQAAQYLDCSPDYLKRHRDIKGGALRAGTHYLPGLSVSAPIKWNVERIIETFASQGRKRELERCGDKILRQEK